MPCSDWANGTEPGSGFVYKTLCFKDDYDGPVTATLVRNNPCLSADKPAILYIHGFIDYFFQKHVALRFNGAGHNFYALDLRKYGRSLNAAKHPNICLAFEEYFPEITEALQIIVNEGHTSVVLMAREAVPFFAVAVGTVQEAVQVLPVVLVSVGLAVVASA